MKVPCVILYIIAALAGGCDKPGEEIYEGQIATQEGYTVIYRVSLFKGGEIELDGASHSIEDVIQLIQEASGTNVQINYYREARLEKPHPYSDRIIASVINSNLPLKITPKPYMARKSTFPMTKGMYDLIKGEAAIAIPDTLAEQEPVKLLRKWRLQRNFKAHFSKVKKGWTKQQLLEYAGEPHEKSAESWLYSWEESHIERGNASSFVFQFREDVVSNIRQVDGHTTKTPHGK